MSLVFDLGNITDCQDVCYNTNGDLSPVTHVLIISTMSVCMGEITKANAAEFYARMTIVDRLHGPLLTGPGHTPRPVTPQDVQDHIGLHTNVTNVTTSAWLRNLKTLVDDLAREYRRTIATKEATI